VLLLPYHIPYVTSSYTYVTSSYTSYQLPTVPYGGNINEKGLCYCTLQYLFTTYQLPYHIPYVTSSYTYVTSSYTSYQLPTVPFYYLSATYCTFLLPISYLQYLFTTYQLPTVPFYYLSATYCTFLLPISYLQSATYCTFLLPINIIIITTHIMYVTFGENMNVTAPTVPFYYLLALLLLHT
jgi:hypothetical protein